MHGSLRRLVLMSTLGGISNAAILVAINGGSESASKHTTSLGAAALFVVALALSSRLNRTS